MHTAPLAEVTVIDLSRHLPGPLTARLLGDLGARIVKVEEPELGDPVRLAPPLRGARSALAAPLLAGVESVALDLKQEGARGVLRRLLERADVLLESFRPGTLARLGLAVDDLRRRYPRLVICSLSGWGQQGPHAMRSGHDLTYQALAGTLAAGAAMPALPTADLLGAWSAAASILAALLDRQRTGRGTWLDASLFDAAQHANLTGLAAEAQAPRAVGERLALSGALPCYNLYRSRDGGWVALAALEPKFWRRLCRAVGRKDLLSLQYDRSGRGRREVARLIAQRERRQWEELFAAHDLPAEPVLSLAEALEHGQSRRRAVVTRGSDGLARVGFPVCFDSLRPVADEHVPELGEHTDRVLAELELDTAWRTRRRRRAAGIGRRASLRRLLWRWSSSSTG